MAAAGWQVHTGEVTTGRQAGSALKYQENILSEHTLPKIEDEGHRQTNQSVHGSIISVTSSNLNFSKPTISVLSSIGG